MDVEAIKKAKKKRKKPQIMDSVSSDSSSITSKACSYCGKNHRRGECPAYGKKCAFCGGKNHFDTVCYKKRNGSKRNKKKKINAINHDSSSVEVDSSSNPDNANQLFIGSLSLHHGESNMNIDSVNLREWRETVNMNGTNIQCKIDTGAECNVISESQLKSVRSKANNLRLDKSTTVLRAYGGRTIPTKGKVLVNIKLNEKSLDTYFYVIALDVNTILGLDTCCKMGLVKPSSITHSPTNEGTHELGSATHTHHM